MPEPGPALETCDTKRSIVSGSAFSSKERQAVRLPPVSWVCEVYIELKLLMTPVTSRVGLSFRRVRSVPTPCDDIVWLADGPFRAQAGVLKRNGRAVEGRGPAADVDHREGCAQRAGRCNRRGGHALTNRQGPGHLSGLQDQVRHDKGAARAHHALDIDGPKDRALRHDVRARRHVDILTWWGGATYAAQHSL